MADEVEQRLAVLKVALVALVPRAHPRLLEHLDQALRSRLEDSTREEERSVWRAALTLLEEMRAQLGPAKAVRPSRSVMPTGETRH